MKQLIRRLARVADSPQYSLLRPNTRRTRSNGVPVYVGEEKERFVVCAEFLNHPIFIQLLKKSAQEYGYEQKGVLRIPCGVLVFRRVLDVLQFGKEVRDLEDEVKNQLFDEFL